MCWSGAVDQCPNTSTHSWFALIKSRFVLQGGDTTVSYNLQGKDYPLPTRKRLGHYQKSSRIPSLLTYRVFLAAASSFATSEYGSWSQ